MHTVHVHVHVHTCSYSTCIIFSFENTCCGVAVAILYMT